MRTFIPLVFAFVILFQPNVGFSSNGPGHVSWWPHRSARYAPRKRPAPVQRYNPYDYYRQVNPKYYGGFHASYFDNLGVPSGDVGLRGNGIYWSPW